MEKEHGGLSYDGWEVDLSERSEFATLLYIEPFIGPGNNKIFLNFSQHKRQRNIDLVTLADILLVVVYL